jgi:hypothetical protein
VTNGTAGTSVVVPAPAGLVNGDQLIAFIASTNVPGHSPPSGWTLVVNTNAGTVKLTCWRKLAASEGASWTWTLGTSERNWGWVGAYSGVDPTTPVTSLVGDYGVDTTLTASTQLTVDDYLVRGGTAIAVAAAVRAASGVATTWTVTGVSSNPTERLDTSTNAGAGTDIAGVVADQTWLGDYIGFSSYLATASQNQTAGAGLLITLNPYFTPYDGGPPAGKVVVEAALGADPDTDSSTWVWTDFSRYVHDSETPITITHGRANRTGIADPSGIAFSLLNLNGEFTAPTGIYTPYMVRNLPFRVRLTGFGVGATNGYHRGTAFLASARLRWDTANWSVVDIVAQGRLRRLQRRDEPLHSAAWTAIQRMQSNAGYSAPVAHWPFEDGSDATSAASAVPGANPAAVTNVTFGSDDSIVGAAPLAQFSATTTVRATVPSYVDTGTWTVMFAARVPAEPAAATTLLDTFTSGTAAGWTVGIIPGAPSALFLQIYDSGGTSIFSSTVAIDEATFYGVSHFYTLTATQNGTAVDFVLLATKATGGFGITNSVAGRTAGGVTWLRVPAAAGLAGIAFGHLAVHVDPGADGATATGAVISGNSGDWPWSRFQRLCVDQNVPYDWTRPTTST